MTPYPQNHHEQIGRGLLMVRTTRQALSSLTLSLLFGLLCLAFSGAWAQDVTTFKTQDPGKGFVDGGGDWRFHTGDDLQWAQPGYDDSSWELLRGDKTWGAQTHPSYVGFAWYRKRIDVTAARGQIALL